MAACVAVISDSNQLLYLRTAECPDPLFYHFKVHAALDVVGDKLAKRAAYSGGGHEHTEPYLGLLYPMEDHRLYGYVTNTQIKFIVVLESPTSPLNSTSQAAGGSSPSLQHQDSEIRSLFQCLHSAYVDLVSSPFYTPKTPILPEKLSAAARFDKRVSELLAERASSGVCPLLSFTVQETPTTTAAVPIKP
ncbi:trafficking protein particle complex subunit 2-like protein [Clonorchis sinensis]|nr:trafficking protein particle complex subunit 2-like protein [Clonorchis sinensis]